MKVFRKTPSGKDLPVLEQQPATAKKEKEVVNAELIGAGLKLVYDAVNEAAAEGNFVLAIGGDHSIATGTIGAMCAHYPGLGVIWIDAHADANTPETSPSMHYHGMPAAHLLGWFTVRRASGLGYLHTHAPNRPRAHASSIYSPTHLLTHHLFTHPPAHPPNPNIPSTRNFTLLALHLTSSQSHRPTCSKALPPSHQSTH
eukprot:5005539-Pleurochrysis_carterae.AAC.4